MIWMYANGSDAQASRHHLGVTLTGDLNQEWDETLAHQSDSLVSRATVGGLHSTLASRWNKLDAVYPTHNFATKNPGKHIDHVLATLPDIWLLEGGSLTSVDWRAM